MTKTEIINEYQFLPHDKVSYRVTKDEVQKSLSFLLHNFDKTDDSLLLVGCGEVLAALIAFSYATDKQKLVDDIRFKKLEKILKRYRRAKTFELKKPEPSLFDSR